MNYHALTRHLLVAFSLTALAALPAHADEFRFTNGNGDNDWTNPGNWNKIFGAGPQTVPGAGDTILADGMASGNPLYFDGSSFSVMDWNFSNGPQWTVLSQSGAGGATLSITGTLTYDGSNTMLFRNSGGNANPLHLSINHVEATGSGDLEFGDGGASTINRLSSLTIGTMNIDDSFVALNVGLDNSTAFVNGALDMSGNSILLIARSDSSQPNNTLQVGSLSSVDTTPIIAANDYNGTTTHGTLDLRTSGTASYAGRIQDGTGTSTGTTMSVIMNGTGTQILTGNSNAYDGDTTANSGTLLVNNTLNTSSGTGNGDVTVNGGTFGGTGYVSGAVSVEAGAVLLGGDGASASDEFSLSGDVTFADMSIISLALGAGGASSELERLGGTWTFDDGQLFSFIDLGAEVGTYEDIITGLSGLDLNDSGLDMINTWQINNPGWLGAFSFDGNNVDLTLTQVPEPTSAALLLGAASLLLYRRRR